jgi:hypothetical protein
MKSLSILIISCLTALSVFAQNNIVVTVTLNGNQNKEVLIDGISYQASEYSNTSSANMNMITVSNLSAGQHTLQVVRTAANSTRRNVGNERVFNLRRGYDLDIVVNGNGTVQLTEKKIRGRRDNNNSNTGIAMNTGNFNLLVRDVTAISTNLGRVSAVNTAFLNTNNYFTSAQISQLVRLTTGDANRIQLLKASYRSVTDPTYFSSLYSLISTTAGRNDVAAYVANYNSTNTNTAVAMNNANFNRLMTEVNAQYNTDARVTVIYNAFATPTNYFSSNQARRLIQTITGEANMIHLAKASYRSIVDKNNFQTVYNLIPTQVGRNDVTYYVSNYDPNVIYNGTGSTTVKTAMPAAEFNTLIAGIRKQWLPGAKKAAVINAFNAGDFFTAAQATQLVQLDSDEPDRLDMAKASYKTLIDPANFVHIINIFNSTAYRNELTIFARDYSATGSTTGSTGYRTAINETEFNSLVNSIRGQWLPGAKKASVINAFTNSGNYFTSSQASQLIQLDNDEPDRLEMAKAAYKALVDPDNFGVVYNLFSTQAYKDELSVYVNANRY